MPELPSITEITLLCPDPEATLDYLEEHNMVASKICTGCAEQRRERADRPGHVRCYKCGRSWSLFGERRFLSDSKIVVLKNTRYSFRKDDLMNHRTENARHIIKLRRKCFCITFAKLCQLFVNSSHNTYTCQKVWSKQNFFPTKQS